MPALLVADHQGRIIDHPKLKMAGRSGALIRRPKETELIPMPPGSELFELPGRRPVGLTNDGRKLKVVTALKGRPVRAVAAFIAPAHTLTLTAAFKTTPGAPVLPLFAYAAVGYHKGRFYVAAKRTDNLIRQDHDQFDQHQITESARRMLDHHHHNRLWRHLTENCALTYGCPAARNLMLGRWEAPLPTARTCNARCLGCLSLQPEDGPFCATQPRLTFTPTAEEVAGVAVPHLKRAPGAVASFGQGCEGEPLMNSDLLKNSIRLIREKTGRGTINLNTNGSRPEAVARLAEAGLDSIRVSVNSLDERRYTVYYRPKGYRLEDALDSVRAMKRAGRFVSLNLLCLPGLTDAEPEVERVGAFAAHTGLDLIQLRNLNIDPEFYLEHVGGPPDGPALGLDGMMTRLEEMAPHLRFGYFNPCLDPEAG